MVFFQWVLAIQNNVFDCITKVVNKCPDQYIHQTKSQSHKRKSKSIFQQSYHMFPNDEIGYNFTPTMLSKS